MPKITGYLAIGNGEPCPFCGVLLDSRPDHKGEDIQKHLFENHKKEVLEKLFPKSKEAQKNVFVRKPPKDKPIEKLFKKFLSEYLKNVCKMLPQSYRSEQMKAGGIMAEAVLVYETKFLKEPFEEAINILKEEYEVLQGVLFGDIEELIKEHQTCKTYHKLDGKKATCLDVVLEIIRMKKFKILGDKK